MPKSPSRNSKLPHRLLSIGRLNFTIVVAFVLVFAGAGTWFVARSQATWLCTQHEYYYYESGTIGGGCPKTIQRMLNIFDVGLSGYSRLGVDGVYGSGTVAQVKVYQRYHSYPYGDYSYSLTVDGTVGANTWKSLCREAQRFGDSYDWNNAGCWSGKYASYPVQ